MSVRCSFVLALTGGQRQRSFAAAHIAKVGGCPAGLPGLTFTDVIFVVRRLARAFFRTHTHTHTHTHKRRRRTRMTRFRHKRPWTTRQPACTYPVFLGADAKVIVPRRRISQVVSS